MSDLKALIAQRAHLSDMIVDARIRETRAALARFKEEVQLYGIPEKDILAALGMNKKAKAPAKYRDPKTGDTWTGRGPKPKWLLGKRLDAYLIDEQQSQAQPWWPEKK